MHILQTLLLPPPGLPDALYLRISGPRGPLAVRTTPGGAVLLGPGETLSTDTYFGAFHLAWWRAHAEIADLAVIVGFAGKGLVQVLEETSAGIVELAACRLATETPERFLLPLRPSAPGAAAETVPSRIFVLVTAAGDGAAKVQTIDFATGAAPCRAVRLSAGIDGGQDGAAALLPQLAAADLEAVFVAGAAPAGTAPVAGLRYLGAPQGDAPGGLAQTVAAARAAGSTHHLLLAADALLDPRLIARAAAFLAHARAPVVLGAVLLDRAAPTVVTAAGLAIGAGGGMRPLLAGADLAPPGTRFMIPRTVDLCPWWFAVLPLAPALAIDPPPGPFRRGDDLALTAALARQGVASVCLPGLALWREPGAILPQPDAAAAETEIEIGRRYLAPGQAAAAYPGAARGADRLHILQTTLLPCEDMPEALYLRIAPARRRGALAPRPVIGGGAALRLDPGDVLSTDTFFGAFYRAYWHAHTAVREIGLALTLRGRARVRVFEDTGAGVALLTEARLAAQTPRRFLVDVPAADLSPFGGVAEARASRLYLEVEAEGPADLHDIAWVSPTPPVRRTTLSIGLCTFNQERYFARTLARLARLAAATPAIRAVHVVNQGAPFQSEAIRDLIGAPKIHAIAQANLGGCGGFTRTLYEELAAPEPASHHLMMDDDIVLDERMILRALRFLDYAEDGIALGAGMLDSLRPTVMYEAGAFLRADNTIHPYAHNVDLADPGQLWHFNTPVETDYNAWWFCILPLERCRAIGLPAPVFIRGDDFEYGQRLARSGVPTVTLPGIAVWHEPFYAKPSGWQDYYDLRNRLIFGATYGDKVRQLSLAHVTGLITTAVLTHNYMAAALRIRAVADFLGGPDRLFARSPEALHAEIAAIARRKPPERLGPEWKRRPVEPVRPRPEGMRALIRSQLGAMLRTGLGPLHRSGEAVLMDAGAHPGTTAGRAYVVTNGPRSYHLRFAPRRGRMWALMAGAAVTALRYRRGRAAAGAAWAARIAAYRDPAWWAGTFGLPPPSAPAASAAPETPAAPPAAEPAAPPAPARPAQIQKEPDHA